MADQIVTKNTLNTVVDFIDGDTRTINLDDPKDDLTEEEIREWIAFAKTNNVFIGDKAGAAISGIKSSQKLQRTQTYLDLT